MRILMATADHLMIDRRIIQEAQSLIRSGHEVRLLAGFECAKRESYVLDDIAIERFVYDWADSRFQSRASRFGLVPGSRRHALAWRAFQKWVNTGTRLTSFDQFILDRMLEYQVDILHVHDLPMLPAAVELAKIRKVPLIYDAHEIYYSQVQFSDDVRKKYRDLEGRLIKSCDEVITVNPYLARMMGERYSVREPNVIMNASPLQPIPATRPLRDRFGLSDAARILIYQGWISDNRGIERIVEATAQFAPGIYTVIVGYGDYEATLKELTARMGLEKRVLFYGGVPSEALHELTCDADLGVIPYHGVDENNYYCSPNKLFEFSVAALPFIANDLPFLRDVATRYGGGKLADLNSADSIARTVNAVFADIATLADLKEGARHAREMLNWTVEERVLLSIYDRVINRS